MISSTKRLAVHDDAVRRNLFAGADLHPVTNLDVFEGDFFLVTVFVYDSGRLDLHFEKLPECFTGLALGTAFEVVPQRDEHQDQRRRVEVQPPDDCAEQDRHKSVFRRWQRDQEFTATPDHKIRLTTI
jgi:hypothetical protein